MKEKESGVKQVVINVFSGCYDGLTRWDKKCGLTKKPMETRIAEDKKILSGMGVEAIYLDFYDRAVYRDIMKRPRPKRERKEIRKLLFKTIDQFSGKKSIFFPGGIAHKDHKLLRKIGLQEGREEICFYEDIPYALKNRFLTNNRYRIGKRIDRKIEMITSYQSQMEGLLGLMKISTAEEFMIKLKMLHFEDGDYYERFI